MKKVQIYSKRIIEQWPEDHGTLFRTTFVTGDVEQAKKMFFEKFKSAEILEIRIVDVPMFSRPSYPASWVQKEWVVDKEDDAWDI